MGSQVYVGPAVTSHDNNVLNTAHFDNVSVSAVSPEQAGFAAYLGAYFTPAQLANPAITGPNADPWGTGVSNLAAYAFAVDPTASPNSSNGGLPVSSVQNDYLTITFIRLRDPFDIQYDVEVSNDLLTWNSGPEFTTQVNTTLIDVEWEKITVRDNVPASDSPRFMRIKVTR
jgi:hypothetical protein